ncbi:MAG TPA: MgtC/SapB family protein [Clostridiales bacterium]|nr:MgtC/SapB family protein [Clostridiales bacterium]
MSFLDILIRIVLAGVLGGIIGIERESINRPAGFRTHILVCVGSALVMITSQYIFSLYSSKVNLDPARLGAQVISGIGFLGAGTIIKERASVKGLTTAASLWAVSCVGLAVGVGFYIGAVVASGIIYLVLVVLKRGEKYLFHQKKQLQMLLLVENKPGQIGKIGDILGELNVNIRDIKIRQFEDDNEIAEVMLTVKLPYEVEKHHVICQLAAVDGIKEIQ